MECKNLKTPNLFRILVIDDQICNDHECKSKTDRYSQDVQAAIEGYFEYAAKKTGNAGIQVETIFAKDPEEGVYLWQSQIFDLTLVDSDFSKGKTSRKLDSEKRSFLDLDLEFFGAYLYRFLCEMQKKSRGRAGCNIALWTGLRLGGDKDQRADDLLSILPSRQKDASSPVLFIPKQESYIDAWGDKVAQSKRGQEILVQSFEGCLSGMVQSNPVLNPGKAISDAETHAEALIARVKSLYCIKPPKVFSSLCGFEGRVNFAWLKNEGNGQVSLVDSSVKVKGGRLLSPLLRRGEDNDDWKIADSDDEAARKRKKEKAKKRVIEKNFFALSLLDIRNPEYANGIMVPKGKLPLSESTQNGKGHIIAAATPLTGCSAVGRQYAIGLMVKKIKALLDGPFGKVVLKTVYLDSLDQWEKLQWPALQAQSHHRTRCLRSTAHPRTLWNTGKTAMESFTPGMMHDFLVQFARENPKKCQNVIVSLGSKFPQWNLDEPIQECNEPRKASENTKKEKPHKAYRDHDCVFLNHIDELKKDLKEIWHTLFSEIFWGKDDEPLLKGENSYPVLEINVRHYLRECVAYHLGGHEYLSPAKIDPDREKKELDFTGCYQSLDLEFNAWLEVLDSIATDFGKKLLLKLPFRGDILHFIRLIRDYVKKHPGTSITGITLINAFKSGVVESAQGVEYSPAWYGRLDAWHDAAGRQWKYQMSGELLTASRNELLGEVLNLVAGADLDAHISGGIVDSEGLRYCSPIVVRADKCRKCGACNRPQCNKGAITVVPSETIATIDQNKCVACGKCIEKCKFGAIVRRPVQIGTWALMDLNLGKKQLLSCANVPPSIGNGRPTVTRCEKCEPCHVQCRHKAFVPSANGIAARIDGGKCVECKECLRMCPCGAITLGDNGTNTSGDAALCTSAILDKRINPRIAFCLHELCNGCGKCSRTFYCDTFMDRRGLDLPPMMDSRNCTGCGLCAQTCPRGAIQLFEPKHVAVLIGKDKEELTAWHRRLTAYEIPHLVYEAAEIEDNYQPCKHNAISSNADSPPSEKDMFEWRIANDSFFDKPSEGYVDERKWDAAQAILEKVEPDSIFRKWLFLAWSDPGQVLKDSPVIYACTTDKCCYFQTSLGKVDCGLQWNDVLNHHSGMAEIKREVDKRLRNLREER